MKKCKLILLLIVVGIFVSSCGAKPGVIAQVGDTEIREEEYQENLDVLVGLMLQKSGYDKSDMNNEAVRSMVEDLKKTILEKLILQEIIKKDCQKLNISVSDREVDEEMELLRKELSENQTLSAFLEENGIKEEYFRNQIHSDLLLKKHKAKRMLEYQVSEQSMKDYYDNHLQDLEEVSASIILMDTEEKAQSIYDRLERGELFEEIAFMESIHKASALKRGELGSFRRGTYNQEIENIAFSTEVGTFSKPVKTELGFIIVRVNHRKDSFEDLKEDIAEHLKEQLYLEDIKKLRDSSKVQIFDESFHKDK